MTINTSTLLNMMKPSLNEGIKDKIQSLSKDGKVEISTLLKEKSIQTLLSSLFKDILQGVKSKNSVNQSLQNSKAMFDFKSISSDIKDIVNNPKIVQNTNLTKQVATLKSFLVDIKNLDNENLKSNIKNSGVFLESKLLKNSKGFISESKVETKEENKTLKLEQQIQTLKKFNVDIKAINTKNVNTEIPNNKNITSDTKIAVLQVKEQLDNPQIQKILDNPKLNEQIQTVKKFLTEIVNTNDKNIMQKVKVNVVNELKETLSDIKKQVTNPNILQEPKQKQQVIVLKQFMNDIKNLEDKTLANLNNKHTNVFQEEKKESNITNDLKANLLQIKDQVDDPKIQKILDQISYHQLLSYSSYSNSTFLPFMWDNIEDGSVSFNSNDKNIFTCSIDLKLKNYGEFKSVLLLENKNNLSLNLRIKSDILKQKVQDNLQILREKINKIGLNLISLNVLKFDDIKTKEQQAYESNINKLSYNIDIKA